MDDEQNDNRDLFLLPFGPKSGDTFSNQHRETNLHWYGNTDSRSCSFPQILNHSIAAMETTFDWLFVCLNGYIELRSFELTSTWLQEGTESAEIETSLRIHVFETDSKKTTAEDNLLDYLCVYSQSDGDKSLNFQYLADPCPSEKQKYDIWDWKHHYGLLNWQRQFLDMNVRLDKETLEAVAEWNKKQNVISLNFRSDDEVSKLLFGADTKFLNLANNVFTRETNEPSDLSVINDYFRSNLTVLDFNATWIYVATWYKTSSYQKSHQWKFLAFFNSFQLVMTCGTKGTTNDQACFLIYDYLELQQQPSTSFPGVYSPTQPGEFLLICSISFHQKKRLKFQYF